jgi:hypothetical protein
MISQKSQNNSSSSELLTNKKITILYFSIWMVFIFFVGYYVASLLFYILSDTSFYSKENLNLYLDWIMLPIIFIASFIFSLYTKFIDFGENSKKFSKKITLSSFIVSFYILLIFILKTIMSTLFWNFAGDSLHETLGYLNLVSFISIVFILYSILNIIFKVGNYKKNKNYSITVYE